MIRYSLLFPFLLLWMSAASLFAQDFVVEKLPSPINSNYDEITPVLSRDGQTLYFTRVGSPDFDRTLWLDTINIAEQYDPAKYLATLTEIYAEIAQTPIINAIASPFNQDIWIATGAGGRFDQIQHPSPPLNNALPNSLTTITPDPNAFYIINQFKPNGEMRRGFSLIKRRMDGSWTFPDSITVEDYYTLKSEVNLTMSFDGQVLILSAARSDSKDLDLYVCFRLGTNHWSTPQHLGNVVNSEKRENTPYLSEDNTTLFFASNRWGNNTDIFMSRRLDATWQHWTEPTRLTQPINSNSDDSQPYFNMTSGYLYFTSRRDGNSDIYRVGIAPPQPTEMIIQGRIFNRKTREIMLNSTVYYNAEDNPANSISVENGFFTLKVPKGIPFYLTAMKPGFLGETKEITFRPDYYYFQNEYPIDLYVDPLEIDARIDLRPIYFEQSKALILEKSFSELDRLTAILQNNPNLQIQVQGHTDNIGKPEDLIKLSEDRAQAIKDFLVRKGITTDRITVHGYGAEFPVSSDPSEEGRAKNRRVEIRITKV